MTGKIDIQFKINKDGSFRLNFVNSEGAILDCGDRRPWGENGSSTLYPVRFGKETFNLEVIVEEEPSTPSRSIEKTVFTRTFVDPRSDGGEVRSRPFISETAVDYPVGTILEMTLKEKM